jgi:hypothetical protein
LKEAGVEFIGEVRLTDVNIDGGRLTGKEGESLLFP